MLKSRRVIGIRRHSNARLTARLSLAVSVVTLTLGLLSAILGTWAWAMHRPDPIAVVANTPVNTGATTWFDPGSTLFSTPRRSGGTPTPTELGCVLYTNNGDRPLIESANSDILGTRVVEGNSLSAVATVGPTYETDRIECSGPLMNTLAVWILPTSPAPNRTPMSIVIGGFALMGLGALVNPHARGARRGLG